ncbi:MAG: Holliday junction branch migration protein RuvA [Gemmatimonadetes bacterium]|jgi:holliday junction DNA helicase RuvA|nr:Holliday junction branch migration protein RuvA [Gemmatimonadota bacterium]MBT7860514.1 Holliday junction branch migration protein RuvA [Gemmatimonadota bacterium]
MIDFLHGILSERTATRAVIDVGGVGYGVAISLTTYEQLPATGTEVHLQTFTYVREDRLELFGFADPEERRMFILLLSVSGIGPNSAQTILSGMSVADLQRAITQDLVTELTQIRGVGRKTAERIVIDLRDKVTAMSDPSPTQGLSRTGGVAGEAVMALVALGIAEAAASKSVDKAMGRASSEPTIQELIKSALRER